MSDSAAPWWAEVQHLRPREDSAPAQPAAEARTPSRRFPRRTQEAALATLEHEVADPWAAETHAYDTPVAPWDEPAGHAAPAWDDDVDLAWAEPAANPFADPADPDGPARPATEPDSWLRDTGLEEAYARTPSWTDDDAWLLPKGADRIENGRRTIEIRGQVDRVHGFTTPTDSSVATRSGRRPSRRAAAKFERRPDRIALWAFLLGLLLITVAIFSKPGNADAAVRAAAVHTAPAAAHVLVLPAPGAASAR